MARLPVEPVDARALAFLGVLEADRPRPEGLDGHVLRPVRVVGDKNRRGEMPADGGADSERRDQRRDAGEQRPPVAPRPGRFAELFSHGARLAARLCDRCSDERIGALALTDQEREQVEKANAGGNTAIVFIHGLWLLASSWDNWVAACEEAGYAGVTPIWPDDPLTVEEARADPDVFAKKSLAQIADHTAEVIGALDRKPAVMGHSTGGLLAQIIAGRGLSAATVAIDPGPFRGVLPLPVSTLKVSLPVLSNPLNRGRAVTLTLDQFKYGWSNGLSEEEAKELHEKFHVAGAGDGADADGERQPQPVHRGEGRHRRIPTGGRC